MALSTLEKGLALALGLEIYKPGTTVAISKKALQASLVLAVKSGRIAAPYAARGLVAAAPPLARAAVNPYIGVPLGLAAATYGTQQYLDESGKQEEINVARDQFLASLMPTAVKVKKRQRSLYNRAMAKSMKVIKDSAYQGKKGTLRNAKKTFGMVSKTVSKIIKGKKVPRVKATGLIKRTIEKAFPGLVKPKPKRRTSSTKTTYTYRK